jgi:RND family efflux transporter MFP subunit
MQGMSKFLDPKKTTKVLVMTLLVITFAACESQRNEYAEPPPQKVTVAQPMQQDVTNFLEFTGTTRAVEEVEVRARVSGFLQSMHFTPGTNVAKGDVLFVIDPLEYQAELDAADAELKSAYAQVKRAETEYKRAKRLFDQKAGAEKDVVKWRGERDIARAGVARAKAKVNRAKLDLGYSKVTAPLSGRISRNMVDIGNLVGENEPTLLATITDYDPMYVYFNINERDFLRVMTMYRQRVKDKHYNPAEESDIKAEIPLFLALTNEEGYPHEGIADYSASKVDPGTGTLQLRGIFQNPGVTPVLVPGFFTHLRMPIDKQANALLVSERAIGADQSGEYVLAVSSENVVEKRLIRMGRLVDGMRVIEEGLEPNESVVVKGVLRARPGAKVEPKSIEMTTLTTSALKKEKEANKKMEVQKKTTAQSENQENEKINETEASESAKAVAPTSEEKPKE